MPGGTSEIGKATPAQALVYDRETPTDADAVTGTMDFATPVTFTKKGTGVYETTVTPSSMFSFLSATAEKGTMSDTGAALIRTPFSLSTKTAIIAPKDPAQMATLKPGDTVAFTIRIFEAGTAKDAPDLKVTVEDRSTSGTSTLTTSKVGTGVYETTFIIPPASKGTEYGMELEWGSSPSASSSYDFQVNFYHVWYHRVTVTTTSATFDIYVADSAGKTVSGATVTGEYEYPRKSGAPDGSGTLTTATTDASGKATFTIPLTDIDGDVDVRGDVSIGGTEQPYDGQIEVTDPAPVTDPPREPMGYGFEVIPQLPPDASLEPGRKADLVFRAYNTPGFGGDAMPWASKEVYFYAYVYEKVLKVGKATTDAQGRFTVSVLVPTGTSILSLEFQAETEPGTWSDAEETLTTECNFFNGKMSDFKDGSLQVSVQRFGPGKVTDVTITWPKATATTQAAVFYAPGHHNLEDMDLQIEGGSEHIDWVPWSGSPASLAFNGNTAETSLLVPEFLPKSGEYTFLAFASDPSKLDLFSCGGDYLNVNTAYVRPGGGGSGPGPTTPGPGLLMLGSVAGVPMLLLLIIVIVVVLAVVVMMRRKQQPPVALAPQAPMGQYPPAGTAPAYPGDPSAGVPPQQPQYQQQQYPAQQAAPGQPSYLQPIEQQQYQQQQEQPPPQGGQWPPQQ